MMTFPDLGVGASVVGALARRDVLARSRTGSGKTLAFGVPIAHRLSPDTKGPAALVLVPTRELATQVVEELRDVAAATGLRVAAVYGGVSIPAQGKAAAKAHILVATPGRMEDLANRRMVSLDGVRVLVLDEADRMLDMGFQPQVDRLVRRIPKRRQTMFFSATLDGEVGRLARAYTTDPVLHEVQAPRQTVDEADHWFIPVAPAERVAAMHGDMTQPARERTLARFEDGRIDTLVATDVAARGIDLDDITHVINYAPPEDDKTYAPRVGPPARAGRAGTGVTFVLPTDERDLSRMAARLKLEDEFIKEGMTVAAPRMVFQSRGGGVMGRRRRR